MAEQTGNLSQQVVSRVTERARDLAKQIAQTVGEPVDATKLKRAEVVRLWNLQNPQANPMQVQQLLAAGQHAQAVDMVYPWRNRLIGKGPPQRLVDRAELFARWASEPEAGSSGGT